MYSVKVDLIDIKEDLTSIIYFERFNNMSDAQVAYVSRVNKYCINRDCTVEYDITLSEVEPKEGHSEIIYRTICK